MIYVGVWQGPTQYDVIVLQLKINKFLEMRKKENLLDVQYYPKMEKLFIEYIITVSHFLQT